MCTFRHPFFILQVHLFVNADNEIHCQKYICFSKLSIPVQQLISGVMILRHGSNVLKTGKLLPQLLNKLIEKKDLKPRDVNTGFLKKNQLARTLCLVYTGFSLYWRNQCLPQAA